MSTIFVITYTKQGSTNPIDYSFDKILDFNFDQNPQDLADIRISMFEKHMSLSDLLHQCDGYQSGFIKHNDTQDVMYAGSLWRDEVSFHNASSNLINNHLAPLHEFNTTRQQFCLLHNIIFQINGLYNIGDITNIDDLTFQDISDIIKTTSLTFDENFIK